jgi:hypothetical protein
LISAPLVAQEMEPKAYSASPVGLNFLVGLYGRSTGDVVFDPSLPFTDVHAGINSVAVGVGHTFDLFGKLTLVSAAFPYAWGTVSGNVGGAAASITRSGLADGRLKLSMNLRGNPAMSAAEFVKAPKRTIVGTSLTVAVPTGQYYDTKLINLGTNRWGFKPEIGFSIPAGRWNLDAYLGAFFFTANPSFYPGGLRRTQEPLVSAQLHAAYTIRSRAWVAVDSTWYAGGATAVAGADPLGGVNNSRLGATLSLPVGTRYSVRIGYNSGVTVRTGTDFQTLAVAWQIVWLSPARP